MDGEAGDRVADLDVAHAGQPRDLLRRHGIAEGDDDPPRRRALEVLDRLDGEQLPVADHRHPAGDVLELGQHVRGEQDRRARRARLGDERLERALEERVEAARRLVEDQHVGLVHERLDEPDLLLVALRQLADRAVERQAEALGERVQVGVVDAAAQPGEEAQQLARVEFLVELELAGEVAEPPPHVQPAAADVEPEDLCPPRGRPQQVE